MLQVNSIHKNWFIVQFTSCYWKEREGFVYLLFPSWFSQASAVCNFFFKENYLAESNRILFALVLHQCGWVIFDHLQELQNLTLKRMRNKSHYTEKWSRKCNLKLLGSHCKTVLGINIVLQASVSVKSTKWYSFIICIWCICLCVPWKEIVHHLGKLS